MAEYLICSGHPKVADFSPYGGCSKAFHCRDPELVLSGPSDTGKTIALLNKIHVCACKYPNASLVIMRRKLTDVYPSVLRTFTEKVLHRGALVTKYGGEKPQWFDYANGSRVWVAGLYGTGGQSEIAGKVLSAEHDMIYVCQGEELSLAEYETLISRVTGRAGNMPYAQIIMDCNPAGPTHWIKARAKQGKLTLIESTHRDNPELFDPETGQVTESGEQRLSRLRSLTGTRLQRLFYGLWAAPEGAVYDIFEGDVVAYGQRGHVVKSFPIPPTWPRAVGIDPFGAQIAATWLAFDPSSGILNVYREYMEPFGLTTAGHAKNVLAETGDEPVFAWVCGGPSERAWRLEWQAAGIPVVEPPISDVWVGIDYVYQLLKEFRLVIHDSCVGLISEIGDYRRKMGRDGVATEKIENKEIYHLLDSIRYVVSWLVRPRETTEVVGLPWVRIA